MPVETFNDDIKNVLAGEKEEEILVIPNNNGGKAIPLVELVFQKECTFNKYLQNGITLEYMYFEMDPNRTTKRIIQCYNCQQWGSNNPKFVKTSREKPSVATSTQQTVIKSMYTRKNMNVQKVVSHQMKSSVWSAARITQHLIKTAKCTRKCGKS